MPDIERISNPLMEYYRHVYKGSRMWDGESLKGKTIVVYCEQGYGDIIQFLRFVPILQKLECEIILHCPGTLRRLIDEQNWGITFLDKTNSNVPKHDYHVLSMSLPFVLGFNHLIPNEQYLFVKNKKEVFKNFNIGVCWECGPRITQERNCPLKHFKGLQKYGKLYQLQKEIRNPKLVKNCNKLELYGTEITSSTRCDETSRRACVA